MLRNGVIPIGRVFGIEIRLHWLFLLLVGILTLSSGVSGGILSATETALFVAALAACVALHELGHSLMALYYKVPVRDITLYPFGGIAAMDLRGVTPKAELLIALAGPAVNFVLALLLTPVAVVSIYYWGISYPIWLLGVNLAMGIFNLLPAFPLDGGRVLRALLTWKSGNFLTATRRAASVGKVIAVGLGVAGLVWDPWLIFLAAVIWYLGRHELAAAEFMAYQQQMASSAGAWVSVDGSPRQARVVVESPGRPVPGGGIRFHVFRG